MGSRSETILLDYGDNKISVVVIAENGDSKTYTINVTRIAPSSNANLSNFTVESFETYSTCSYQVYPDFSPDITEYTVYITRYVTSIHIKPVISDPTAIITIDGSVVNSGNMSMGIDFYNESMTIPIVVKAQSGAVKTYNVKAIHRNSWAILKDLKISTGVMPLFDSYIDQYYIDVHETINSILVYPNAYDVLANIQVNGNTVISGSASAEINIASGINTVPIVVTADNGVTTKTYSLIINKLNLLNFNILCGIKNTMILKSDGTLWVTGDNFYNESSPFTPSLMISDVASVSASEYHIMIVKKDGTLWAYGSNFFGQLGNGTNIDTAKPVQIMTDVASVSAGSCHTMIVKKDGTLWATGRNNRGQLGNGTYIDISKPVQIMTDVVSVSAGSYHTMIIKNDGTLFAFGSNSCGELGLGTVHDYEPNPVQVMSDVTSVYAGETHTMIIDKNGKLYGAGYFTCGQLSSNIIISSSLPEMIMEDVLSVSSGSNHILVLKKDRTLWGIGLNSGRFGTGSIVRTSVPIKINDDVNQVYAGSEYSIIQKGNGTFWATGDNSYGQFGNGTTTSSTSFIQLPW